MNEKARVADFRRILVATDFSRPSRLALASAENLARGTDAEIVLVNVFDLPCIACPEELDLAGLSEAYDVGLEEARVTLRAMALQARARGTRVAEVEVLSGHPWIEIIDAAGRHQVDLVILGNSGRGRFHRFLLGSTAERVVRHSSIPVLVIRGRALRNIRRVLVPVAHDQGSRAALTFAIERFPSDVEIEAFHAVPTINAVEPWVPLPPPQTEEARHELRTLLDAAGAQRVTARAALANDPARAILDRARAWQADLILLSTRGRAGFTRVFLGSVAEKVAREADRPVLVLPPASRTSRVPRPIGEWTRSSDAIGAGELVLR